MTSIEFFLSKEKIPIENNLIAAIIFFLSALDIYINLTRYFLEYPNSDDKKFDKNDFETKLKYLFEKSSLGDQHFCEILNLQKIRNRFMHVTKIKCVKHYDYTLIEENFANKPHSSQLMFHPQEIEECIEVIESFLKIITDNKSLRYISKIAKSRINNFSTQDLCILVGYIQKNDFRTFSRTLNFVSGRIDHDNNFLQKYHGIEQDSGGRVILPQKRGENK